MANCKRLKIRSLVKPQVLKVHTLDKSYVDRDTLLLHAAFQIFTDYIERERPFQFLDWGEGEFKPDEWPGEQEWLRWRDSIRPLKQELEELYNWWKVARPARKSPLDEVESPDLNAFFDGVTESPAVSAAFDEYCRLEDQWDAEDQAMLHRLIDIRPTLWT